MSGRFTDAFVAATAGDAATGGARALPPVVRERGILFSAPMVRALLDGSKTQTRRVVKPPSGHHSIDVIVSTPDSLAAFIRHHCPYGKPGDRLWVRETWARTTVFPGTEIVVFREGDNRTDYGGPWKPGIHLFRRDSRITLEITDVRVERLLDICDEDAIAEGIEYNPGLDPSGPCKWRFYGKPDTGISSPTGSYQSLWDSINGTGSAALDSWVWAISFRRI